MQKSLDARTSGIDNYAAVMSETESHSDGQSKSFENPLAIGVPANVRARSEITTTPELVDGSRASRQIVVGSYFESCWFTSDGRYFAVGGQDKRCRARLACSRTIQIWWRTMAIFTPICEFLHHCYVRICIQRSSSLFVRLR
jgi:hypothetical protein